MDYMKLAVEATIKGIDKKFGGPFGSVIVRNNEVIAAVSNTMTRDTDISAHAEMVAIREASKKLNTMDLSDCEIYATCEPCPMCMGAIIWSGIKKVYYHSTNEEAAKYGFSDKHLRSYFNGEDDSIVQMTKVDKREDCDHLWEYYEKTLNENK